MTQLMGPQFSNLADYDCIVTAVFRNIEDFVKMKADPYYKEKVMPDHENFADTKRSKYEDAISQNVSLLIKCLQNDCWLDRGSCTRRKGC